MSDKKEHKESLAKKTLEVYVLENLKDEIMEQYFGDSREEYFDVNDSPDYKDGAIEAADYIVKMIDKHIARGY